MFPEFPELAKLTDQGRRVIRRHVRSSFLSDGGYEERSASYTFGPMRMFMMPMELASLNRARLFAAPERRLIKRCVETMAQTAMPHGAPPDVGDGSASVEKVGKLLGQSARMLGSDLSADVIRRLKLRRYVRPEDVDALKAVARRELPLTVHLPASGYFVARDGWTPNASAMSLSVPARGLPNHAHDDALSLQLVVRGVPVVGTPMTTMYNIVQQDRYRNNVIPLRGHFHAMTSHNLVLVNGEPLHSIEELARNWSVEPTPVKTSWEGSGGGVRVVSIHRSYPGVRLEREVTFRYRTGWVVWDRVRGAAGRPHIARWHFEYGVDVVEEGDAYMAVRGRGGLRIRLARSLSGYLPPS